MPYEPLHHKYRPQTFSDLVGQETIALTLTNALRQEKIAPAYLFTGPRGTGKTSSARILAKSLNCLANSQPTPEPCGKCEACLAIARGSALDVMEIDAASNTGVDNIREIIERSRFAPVQCRYKIYVIDECHMLSTAAFNALLKTLEEPPPRVVFILATTDPQRVLSTIVSRCQRFDYRRIPLEAMTAHLKYIADAEQIAIADDALTLISQIANGGLRDAESLLDQLSLLPETITVERVWDLVGAVPERDLLQLLRAIDRNDSIAVLQQCRGLLDRGREPIVVLQNLASFYLNLLVAKTAPQHSELTAVTEVCWQQLCAEAANWDTNSILRGQQQLKEAETQLKHTTQPRLWLEVTLLGLLSDEGTQKEQRTTVDTPLKIPSQPSVAVSNGSAIREVKSQTAVARSQPEAIAPQQPQKIESNSHQPRDSKPNYPATAPPSSPRTETEPAHPSPLNSASNREIWSKVVSCLQPPTTQALLKQQCHLVSFDGSSAVVGISSAKLQKLNQGKIPNIEAAFARVCQHKVKVRLEVANARSNAVPNPPAEISKSSPARSQLRKQDFPQTSTATAPAKTEMSQSTIVRPKENAPPGNLKTPRFEAAHSLESNNKPQAIAQDTPSPPPALPEEEPMVSPTVVEPAADPDYDDDELQRAIDNLTHSFEGELVQLDNFSENEGEPHLSDRPDIEEYDDDW